MRPKRALGLGLMTLAIASCNDGPLEPRIQVNPALLEALQEVGMTGGGRSTIPFAAGEFVGPDGVVLDAVGIEFIQEVEIAGETLRTSGISVVAVPKEGVAAPYEKVRVSLAQPGSLASVAPGTTIQFKREHEFDFRTPVLMALARVGVPGEERTEWLRSGVGSGTVIDVSISGAMTECDLTPRTRVRIISCTEQMGTVTIAFDFVATNEDGTQSFTQQRTTVEVPTIRQSLVAEIVTEQ